MKSDIGRNVVNAKTVLKTASPKKVQPLHQGRMSYTEGPLSPLLLQTFSFSPPFFFPSPLLFFSFFFLFFSFVFWPIYKKWRVASPKKNRLRHQIFSTKPRVVFSLLLVIKAIFWPFLGPGEAVFNTALKQSKCLYQKF